MVGALLVMVFYCLAGFFISSVLVFLVLQKMLAKDVPGGGGFGRNC